MTAAAAFHATAALLALALGARQLARRKAGPGHRAAGYAWVLAMLATAISSFWLKSPLGLAWLGGFSPIHGLSLFTILALVMALRHAILREFDRHRRWVAGAYAGLAGAGVFAVASPGRAMHELLFVSLPRLLSGGWDHLAGLAG